MITQRIYWALCIIPLLAACDDEGYCIKGRVFDKQTSQPIEKVEIQLKSVDWAVATQTNEKGEWHYSDAFDRTEQVNVFYSKKGYKVKSDILENNELECELITVELDKQ